MKFAVIAGTPVDTRMGANLLAPLPLDIIQRSVSNDPSAQTFFQTLPYEEKKTQIKTLLEELKQEGLLGVLVYCNSLSGAVDFSTLSQELDLPIITPFQMYQTIARDYHKLGVLAANAQGASGIETVLVQSNPQIQVYNLTNLDWVKAVEDQLPSTYIAHHFGLPASKQLFNENQVEAVLIGCTHFPYFIQPYEEMVGLPCLNPDQWLYQTVANLISN